MAAIVKPQAEALVNFASSGEYPEDDDASPADDLNRQSIVDARNSIQNARQTAQAKIKAISRQVGPDVDGWIERAKQLQFDIQQSRHVARAIVEESEQAQRIQERRTDAAKKTRLLEAETAFHGALVDKLNTLNASRERLSQAREAATSGATYRAFEILQQLEHGLSRLGDAGSVNAADLLYQRVTDLRNYIVGQARALTGQAINIDHERRTLRISSRVISKGNHEVDLPDVVGLSSSLGLLQEDVSRIGRDVETAILGPILANGSLSTKEPSVEISTHVLKVSRHVANAPGNLIHDLIKTLKFIKDELPNPFDDMLAEKILPPAIAYLISHKLPAALPTDLKETGQLDVLSKEVRNLTEFLRLHSWSGSADLQDWVDGVPRAWFGKRREASIDHIRGSLAGTLAIRKSVEHVETQVLSSDDAMVQNETIPTDEWDEDWGNDEDDENKGHADNQTHREVGGEDEWGGWDADEKESGESNATHAKGGAGPEPDRENEDDWGDWEEREPESKPTKNVKPKQSLSRINGHTSNTRAKPVEHEVTLRETYTTTALPDEIYASIEALINDAHDLRSPEYSSSPINAAAPALYTIPTVMTSSFRSLAPPAYELLQGGHMLLFNDSNRLSSQLSSLRSDLLLSSNPGLSRLKLESDIQALEGFARRSYSKAMEEQRTILRDLIDNAQGFANCTTAPYKNACDDAVNMTVAHLHSVAELWRAILSRNVWLQALGSLLGTIIGKIVVDIEEMTDIGAEESTQLKQYVLEISQLRELFRQNEQEMTGLYVRDWFKFQYLAEVLESNMEDIKFLWKEGGLKDEFDVEEVVELVEALFADGDRRRRAIAEIRRG